MRIYDLRQKEVINIKDGCRYGFACDVILDIDEGEITHVIVPGPGKVFGMLGREKEYKIPWCDVKQVGEDIILVSCETGKVFVDCD